MQVLDSLYDLTNELSRDSFREPTFSFEAGVDLALRRELQNQVEGVVIFVVIEQLDNVLIVELVHDLDFELNLLNKVVLNDLCLVYNFDSINVLRLLMAHFINFTKPTNSYV